MKYTNTLNIYLEELPNFEGTYFANVSRPGARFCIVVVSNFDDLSDQHVNVISADTRLDTHRGSDKVELQK